MLINQILDDYNNHRDLTCLELSSAAFTTVLKEVEDKLIKPEQPLSDTKADKTINGLPLRIVTDNEIWFQWK